ncbi:MAG: FAD:protein FMN transferase [Burkholderiaceae bacterium]
MQALTPLLPSRATDARATTHMHGSTMGTTWRVVLAGRPDAAQLAMLREKVLACLDDLCNQMSHWQPDSLISRINRAEAGWYAVPDDAFHVLSAAMTLAESTAGAFDPTIGELAVLWGFGPGAGGTRLPPDEAACRIALACGGWQRTQLNPQHRAIWQPGGLHFDLSSIAKGYAVDRLTQLLHTEGLHHHLVEIGGEVRACGTNPRGSPWRVAVETPSGSQQGNAGMTIRLTNQAVASSGNYRQWRSADGRWFGHTLDPRTGRPATHTLQAVSVLHDSAMMADALATTLMVLGPEAGPAYARQRQLAAVFMCEQPDDDTGHIFWTPEFEARAA